ncbi:MAG: cyclodeaminase/cyclohydrolase family protein [Firmicutes bacterium]|nr:cyclodeaminase/cyclohydrolase family protein [Bacillota bacterium]
MFENTTIKEFTEQLASPSSVPGGGGASALVGAIGIALGDMVGEHTVGKKKYIDVEEDLKALMARAQDLRARLVDCVERDAVAFEPLSRAYKIPKDEPGRDEILERCLRDAAQVPLEVFEICLEAIEVVKEFKEKGSRLIISDAATAAVMLKGAMYGAAINVKVNTNLMKDREYADEIADHVDEKLKEYEKIADQIFESYYSTL